MNDAARLFNTPAAVAVGVNLTINQESTPMARHTIMPPRNQKTPHGDVTLTSKWMRDHYMLMASGSRESLRWLFPNMQGDPELHGNSVRHAFSPAPNKITIERDLRRICAKWQDAWNGRLEDHVQGSTNAESAASKTSSITTLGQLFDHLYEQRKASVARSTSDRDRYDGDINAVTAKKPANIE